MPQAQEVASGDAASDYEWNKARRAAVLAELNRILADPAFRNSKRCADLLRRLVEHGLSGEHQGMKERTLGIEVFGRNADYDNNADPIVRRTANEIRKRLAQYYQQLDNRQPVKIHLIPGSYLPEFDFSATASPSNGPSPEVADQFPGSAEPPELRAGTFAEYSRRALSAVRRNWVLCSALVLSLALAGLILADSSLFRSSQYLFWHPLLQSKDSPIVCVADENMLEWNGLDSSAKAQRIASMIASRGTPRSPTSTGSLRAIPYVDANAAHQLAGWFTEHGRSTVLEPASMLTLQEFRRRPAVLIGGFDNPWTLTLLSGLRFSPRLDPANQVLWIRDAHHPASRDWAYAGEQSGDSTIDYAVITRFFDSETGNWLFAIAGLGQHGTDAASQFLIDPAFSASLPAGARSKRNFQMVIKTTIIRDNTGPPQLVAFDTW